MQLSKCGQSGLRLGTVTAEQRNATAGQSGQDTVRANLQERGHTLGTEVFQGVVEADRVAD
ncbi:hypothetical protein, partial [Streptomyces violaceoruber]|uniref:hypothetical protein n=1 Tax=Streptomyces violaceoruber TaxID=1935 RepID=UPI001F32A3F2